MSKATLLDLAGAEAPASVKVRGRDIAVTGLPIAVIARFMRDCPEVATMLSKQGKAEIDVGQLLATAPDSVGMLIAAGVGHYGEADWERIANQLAVTEQVDLLKAILEVTLPGGIGPFAERLKGLAKAAGVDLAALMASSTS